MPTATLETPLPTRTSASTSPSAASSSTDSTSQPAVPARHRPRRTATATSRLRAIDTRALDLGSQMQGGDSSAGPGSDVARRPERAADRSERTEHAVRSLSLRELVTGAGTAAGAWTLAAHLGLLGTAGGVFLISLVSTTGVALVADSLTGARRMLVRVVGGARRRRAHRRRIERATSRDGRIRG
ncbi:hypothetical protein [Brachybacterium sp. NPDC056505]|uniref:hypothetical protein n=1 Tax=Brachybacterium sp. NPDC056505 TaxID=3345843 RepID=UPI003672FD7F